jgi:hypothetical protein
LTALQIQQKEAAMKVHLLLSLFLGLVVANLAVLAGPALAADPEAAAKVYELRVYHANPGKLEALHARFRDHTCELFKKHGFELVAFWTPATGEEAKNTLYYIVAFPSAEAQKKAWEAFRADPEWIKAKADSEKEGSLVRKVDSTNLKATDYSPMK